MGIEIAEKIHTLQANYKEIYGSSVIFEGDFPDLDGKEAWIWTLITGLVINCIEKGTTLRGKGATHVTVTLGMGRLRVSDNFHYSEQDAQATLAVIRYFQGRNIPGMTTKSDIGGVGLWSMARVLERHRGKLEYSVEDGGIVATARWEV